MGYISVKEAALRWSIGASRIGRLAREGRIEGAKIVGRNWLIPEGADKPCDRRMRLNKSLRNELPFRFPLFINEDTDYESYSLSDEEKRLKSAQVDFFSCNFSSSLSIFEDLANRSENKYIKICSLFFLCLLSMEYDSKIDWKNYYSRLQLESAEDFPHKKEMELFSVLLHVYCADLQSVADNLIIDAEYSYHPSCQYLCMYLTFFYLTKSSPDSHIVPHLEIYEMLCQKMETDGHFFEAQELHRILFVAYLTLQNEKESQYHLKCLLYIANKKNLLFAAADLAPYYTSSFQKLFPQFPPEFTKKIMECGNPMYANFVRFTEKHGLTDIFFRLSKKDYQILLYVFGGYSNKKISKFMGISEHTVANNLAVIYEKLGLNGKKELFLYITQTLQFGKNK